MKLSFFIDIPVFPAPILFFGHVDIDWALIKDSLHEILPHIAICNSITSKTFFRLKWKTQVALMLHRGNTNLYISNANIIVDLMTYIPEVCAGLKFVSGSRQRVEISGRLPARLPGDLQFLVPAYSWGKNFLSMSGPGPGQVPVNKTLVPAVPACPFRPGIRESRIRSGMNLSCLSMFSWN